MEGKVSYKIVREMAVLSERTNGWTKQLNLISWNGAEPKYDIRDWAPDRTKISEGISLNAAELQRLSEVLEELEL